jgi:hypothetical protein
MARIAAAHNSQIDQLSRQQVMFITLSNVALHGIALNEPCPLSTLPDSVLENAIRELEWALTDVRAELARRPE